MSKEKLIALGVGSTTTGLFLLAMTLLEGPKFTAILVITVTLLVGIGSITTIAIQYQRDRLVRRSLSLLKSGYKDHTFTLRPYWFTTQEWECQDCHLIVLITYNKRFPLGRKVVEDRCQVIESCEYKHKKQNEAFQQTITNVLLGFPFCSWIRVAEECLCDTEVWACNECNQKVIITFPNFKDGDYETCNFTFSFSDKGTACTKAHADTPDTTITTAAVPPKIDQKVFDQQVEFVSRSLSAYPHCCFIAGSRRIGYEEHTCTTCGRKVIYHGPVDIHKTDFVIEQTVTLDMTHVVQACEADVFLKEQYGAEASQAVTAEEAAYQDHLTRLGVFEDFLQNCSFETDPRKESLD